MVLALTGLLAENSVGHEMYGGLLWIMKFYIQVLFHY
jgi:hypothetical protein